MGVAITESVASRRDRAGSLLLRRGCIALLLIATALINLWGASYYLADIGTRVRHPWHALLKPSGMIGQVTGTVAFALFLFLWLYPLRKRWRWMARLGSLAAWLDWHVAAGLVIPILAATHAGWRFSGVIGLAYGAMFLVFMSGLVGRYLYAHIPRHRSGLELTLDEAAGERDRLLFEIVAATGLPVVEVRRLLHADDGAAEHRSAWAALVNGVADDWRRWRGVRHFMHTVRHAAPRNPSDAAQLRAIATLARREIALGQQLRLLAVTQRLFRHWHAAHQPVAIAALVGVVAHVVVAVVMGATWWS